jgi:hypothetical protein
MMSRGGVQRDRRVRFMHASSAWFLVRHVWLRTAAMRSAIADVSQWEGATGV